MITYSLKNLCFAIYKCRIVILFLTVFCCLTTLKVSATPPPGYYLVWSDEFDGDSLDLSKWNYFDQISQNAQDNLDALVVSNGLLTINLFTSNSVNYTSIIGTDGHFRSYYGYYESSIQFCDSNATWSAFWIQTPTSGQYIGDPSVEGTELDIAEHRYVDVSNTNVINDWVQETLHWDGYAALEKSLQIEGVGSGLASDFHTYGFTWTPTNYQWAIDDKHMNTATVGLSGRSEVIMLSSQVQTPSWSGISPAGGYGNYPSNTTKMTVDYVRYYVPLSMVFWTGASSSNWSDSANWFSNMTATATNDVVFDWLSTGNFDISIDQPSTVNSLTIQETPPMNFNGNPLTIVTGIDLVSALNDATFSCPLVLGGDQIWKTAGGRQITVTSEINGAGNLTVSGYGTVDIAGTNLSSGVITVAGGTLYVAGLITNSVFVSGGNLAGPGLILGPVQVNGGTVSVNYGNSPSISNSLTFGTNGSATFAVDATANTSALLAGLPSVAYGGTLILNNVGGAFSASNTFKLFNATNYSGAFAAISPATPGFELAWDTSTLTLDGKLRVKNVVAVVTTNILESHSGSSTGGVNNPAFSFQGFTSTISSAKSTAPGLTSMSCRFANTFSPAPSFSVTPTLLVGPTYTVDVTWGKISGNFFEVPSFLVTPTVTGVSSSTLPSTSSAFSGGPSNNINNIWIPVGTITPNIANPTLTFTYLSGFTSGRWYVDSIRFTSILPTPGAISSAVESPTNMVLNWTGNFILQTATNVEGPYVDVLGPIVVGPYTNFVTTNSQQFFRLRQ